MLFAANAICSPTCRRLVSVDSRKDWRKPDAGSYQFGRLAAEHLSEHAVIALHVSNVAAMVRLKPLGLVA